MSKRLPTNSQILTGCCMKLKLNMFMTILVRLKKCLNNFSNYSAKLKYYDSSNTAIVKMKDEMSEVAIEEFLN